MKKDKEKISWDDVASYLQDCTSYDLELITGYIIKIKNKGGS